MAYSVIAKVPEGCDSFITVTSGVSGFFAVHMWLNTEEKDLGPFWEPYDTGFGRYATREEAAREAKQWALSEDMPVLL